MTLMRILCHDVWDVVVVIYDNAWGDCCSEWMWATTILERSPSSKDPERERERNQKHPCMMRTHIAGLKWSWCRRLSTFHSACVWPIWYSWLQPILMQMEGAKDDGYGFGWVLGRKGSFLTIESRDSWRISREQGRSERIGRWQKPAS